MTPKRELCLLLCCVTFLHIKGIVDGKTVTVSTRVGTISGYTENVSADGQQTTISKFMGIPFAETTAGQNRFLKPIPKAPFSSTFMATGSPVACIQMSKESTKIVSSYANFSEDCLTLNVYVPHDFTTNASLPVMVWIYGGGFTSGASALYPADIFTAYTNTVVVTINYRLGMFGFLHSADGKMKGNQGLWDQHLALKWVHDNIMFFTGNPGQVTIFGESAGGASVLFHALYPGNRGLFQGVIAESGSPLANWATATKPNFEEFVKRAGCDTDMDKLSCLRAKTSSDLQMPSTLTLTFNPNVDGNFLIESPEEILFGSNMKSDSARAFYYSLDILSGVNNFDGFLYMSAVWQSVLGFSNFYYPKITRAQFENIVLFRTVIDILAPKDNNTRDILQNVLSFEYTNWTDPNSFESTRMSTVLLSNDVAFFFPAVRAAQGHAAAMKGSTYFYEFSPPLINHTLPTPPWITGSNHADEVKYVFCKPLQGKPAKEADKQLSRAVATTWSNFAKSGNPNAPEDVTKFIHTTWPEYSMTSQNYLRISYNMSALSVKEKFNPKKMTLWSEVLPKIKSLAGSLHIPYVPDLSGLIVGK